MKNQVEKIEKSMEVAMNAIESNPPNPESEQPQVRVSGSISVKIANSDVKRKSLLDQIVNELANNPHEICVELQSVALEPARALQERLGLAVRELKLVRMQDRDERKKQREAVAKLKSMIQDVWLVLPLRFKDDASKSYYEQRFGLSAEGLRPKARDAGHLIEYAQQILEAEAEVVGKGYEPMSRPSAESLSEALNVCIASRAAVAGAMARKDSAKVDIDPLRKEVDAFFRDFRGRIRIASSSLSPQARRNRQRIFGFEFASQGQVVAREEEPAGNGGEV